MRVRVGIDDHLPMVCARSGEAADVVVVHELIDSPTWSWLAFVLGPMAGVVAQLVMSDVRRVQIPAERGVAKRFFATGRATAWLLAATLLLLPVSMWAAAGAFATVFVARALLLRWIWVRPRWHGDTLTIDGVHALFDEAARELSPPVT